MIQAGSIGAPYIPVLGLAGTDLLQRREDMKILPDPFNPEVKTVVAKAYRPDFAIFHAQKADGRGNVSSGWHNDDILLAEAARHVIVTVEEMVEQLEESGAKGSFLPGILVNTVVHAPFGAHPAGCPDYYEVDSEHMKHYARQSTSDEAFEAYLEETTYSVSSHQAYVEKFVPAAWRQAATGERATDRATDRATAGDSSMARDRDSA